VTDTAFRSIVARFDCLVHWGDCDPLGIIFYPTYFRWMDAATWSLLDGVYGIARMKSERRVMPLVSAECRFLHPAEHNDRCEVRSRIERFGGKSFVVAHEIVREDGTALASGTETRVWARRQAEGEGPGIRGDAIPDAIKALFAAP